MSSRMYVHLFCRSSSNITCNEMDPGENNGILGRHRKNKRLNKDGSTPGMCYKCS
jgi:hypothetical protein